MLSVREFTSAAELIEHNRRVAQMRFASASSTVPIERVRPMPKLPEPDVLAEEVARAKLDKLNQEIEGLERAHHAAIGARRDAMKALLASTKGVVSEIEGLWKLKELRDLVCLAFGVSPIGLSSERRDAEILRPRQIYCWLAKRFSVSTLNQIGSTIGKKDHTTVLHSARRIQDIILTLEPPEQDTPTEWVKLLLACDWPPPLFHLKKR